MAFCTPSPFAAMSTAYCSDGSVRGSAADAGARMEGAGCCAGQHPSKPQRAVTMGAWGHSASHIGSTACNYNMSNTAGSNGNSLAAGLLLSTVSAGGAACYTLGDGGMPAVLQQQHPHQLAQHSSLPPCMDFDALLAAASRKPGYACCAEAAMEDSPTAAMPPAANNILPTPAAAKEEHQAAVAGILQQYGARAIPDGNGGGIAGAALDLIAEHGLADTFYLYDLGEVRAQAAGVLAYV